jgi:hypothetical protein
MMIISSKKQDLLVYFKTTMIQHFLQILKTLIVQLGKRVGITHPATNRGTENLIVRRE